MGVTAPNNETIAFTWDAGGRLIEQRLNSGIKTTQTWFEDGSLKQKQNLYNATVLSSHLYTLDQQGRRAGQTENINAVTKTWCPVRVSAEHFRLPAPRIFLAFNLPVISLSPLCHRIDFIPSAPCH